MTDEERDALKAEIERLQWATRTRTDYDVRCQRCGAAHNIDTSIPSDVWNQIEDGKWGMLCTLCIDELLSEKGLTCEAEFYFVGKALTGKHYSDRLEAEVGCLSEGKDDLIAVGVALTEKVVALRRALDMIELRFYNWGAQSPAGKASLLVVREERARAEKSMRVKTP